MPGRVFVRVLATKILHKFSSGFLYLENGDSLFKKLMKCRAWCPPTPPSGFPENPRHLVPIALIPVWSLLIINLE